MIELVTNLEVVSSLLNVNVKKRFLSVVLNYDGYKAVAPKIVKVGNKKFLLTRHIELGNIMAQKSIDKSLPSEFKVVFYDPYFTFEVPKVSAFPEFIDAFDEVARGEKEVAVHKDLPVLIYQLLQKKYKLVLIDEEVCDTRFIMYEFSKEEVLERFNLKRKEADKIAMNLVDRSPFKKDFERYILNRNDLRFETLEELMEADGLDAVLCTSPLGIQEITGHGITRHKEDESAALYIKGGRNIYFFAKQPIDGYKNGREVDSFTETVDSLIDGGVVGIEEQHFPVGWLKGIGFGKIDIKNSMAVIRRFRENRAWEDLSYYIIAARASVYAIDGALKWARDEIVNGKQITELDVEKKYEALVKDFKKNYNIPFIFNTFWTNCHAGDRSLHPSLATNYLLNKNTKTLKLDACISIIGDNGTHHAASDIARTLIFEEEVQKAYEKFENYLLMDVIPNIKPGMAGKDIYNLAVSRVEKEKNFFKVIGIMPNVEKLESIFNRDVGHLMGLQPPVTLVFNKTAEETVIEGMIASFEYQWSIKDYSIGIEDNFIIGPSGGLNFSRDNLNL